MKEIGGYFGLERLIHKEYYPDLIPVTNARSALVYLMYAKEIKKIYIPYFLCESVANVCKREGHEFEFYHIDSQFSPIFEKKLQKNEWLYIVNYYGQITPKRVLELKEKYGNIIVDNVQAFFQKPQKGIDTIYSCRKFFGVPDGGYLSTNVKLERLILRDISKDRMTHLLGRFEGNASDYYEDFKRNDKLIENVELRYMSELTHNILGAIDYEQVICKRTDNYNVLDKILKDKNRLKLENIIAPYAYPFYCDNGMMVKKKLADKKIYIPTLWPNVLKLNDTIEKEYAENILPVPIDQRYDYDDMVYIAEEINKCIN